ncbi:MAG: hypothetical protein QM733_15655 [Ilumatobacteraceae bacterium]
MTSRIVGRWRIVGSEAWNQDDLDLVEPATIEFGADRLGRFRLIAVEGDLDARFVERDGLPAVEFSWDGFDELDPASGRGWAVLGADGALRGRIFFHRGDDSEFWAERLTK